MKAVQSVRDQVERLVTTPAQELGRWARFARFQLSLWRFCARRLWQHNVSAMSAALSFRTIFAMVPAIVLAVLVLKSVGVLEDSKRSLRSFLEASGVTQIALVESGEAAPDEELPLDEETAADEVDRSERVVNVADEIESIVSDVEAKLTFGRVGPVGVVLLIWTALTLLTTIERSLNRIFDARRPRSVFKRLLLYWSALTLGPLLLIAGGFAGRQVTATFESVPVASWVFAVIGRLETFLVAVIVVAAVYKLLPSTKVRYRSAVGGAVVAVPLWMLAKWGFAVYVTDVVGTGNLYGALGLLPLFLIWLNLSWWIFLFGAQLAHTAANLEGLRVAERVSQVEFGPSDLLAAAVAVGQPYQAGQGPVTVEEVASRLGLTADSVQGLLDRLEASRLICPTGNESDARYVLARPAERIPLLAVIGVADSQQGENPAAACQADLAETLHRTWATTRTRLGEFTLADILHSDSK